VNRLERFNAALAEAGGELSDATTPKKKSEPKAKKADSKDDTAKTEVADEKPAEEKAEVSEAAEAGQ
jgi:hypothetical protein